MIVGAMILGAVVMGAVVMGAVIVGAVIVGAVIVARMIVGAMIVMVVVPVVIMVLVIMVMVMVVPRRRRTMIVVMIMRMVVIMRGLVVVRGSVVVAMHPAMAIGAAFRIERRLDRRDDGAEPFQHCLDDMVAADAQPVAEQFGRQMPIAEMPGDTHEMRRIARRHLGEGLRRRLDLDDAAILQHQPVAMAERDGPRQVEQERRPALGRHGDPPPMPRIEIEHHRVGGSLRPQAGGIDGNGSDHSSHRSGRRDAMAAPA